MPLVTRCLVLALILALPCTALADETVIYRCTGADGSLSLQSMPCPKGSQQQVRRLSADYAPPPLVFPVDNEPVRPSQEPLVERTTPAATETASPIALPALHRCQPRRGPAYLTDDLADSVRCLPLQVTGLDGNPATGAGEACEVQRDACAVVAATDTCPAWQDYLAQSRQRYADAPMRDNQASDVRSAQIAALLAASACMTDTGTAQNP